MHGVKSQMHQWKNLLLPGDHHQHNVYSKHRANKVATRRQKGTKRQLPSLGAKISTLLAALIMSCQPAAAEESSILENARVYDKYLGMSDIWPSTNLISSSFFDFVIFDHE